MAKKATSSRTSVKTPSRQKNSRRRTTSKKPATKETNAPEVLGPKQAADFFIGAIVGRLRDLGLTLEEEKGLELWFWDQLVSSKGKRESRDWRVVQCVPRVSIAHGKNRGEVGIVCVKIVIENVHVCHPSMIDSLTSLRRDWKVDFSVQSAESTERTRPEILQRSSRLVTIILAHYLRVRQICIECMLESERLSKEARQFVACAIEDGMGN